jgi:hypothetical protein
MKESIIKISIYILFGFILGLNFSKNKSDQKTSISTDVRVDTCYIHSVDLIHVDRIKIKHKIIRDTIPPTTEPPKIQEYSADFLMKHGKVNVYGEVYGEVLKMNVKSDLNLPFVTKTVTVTNTIVKPVPKNSNGLFITAGIQDNLNPTVGAVFVRNKFIGGYNYKFDNHHIYIGKKLF